MRKSDKYRISNERLLDIIDDEVFQHQDFQRHLKETAKKLDLPDDVVETVVKNFVLSFALEINKVKRIARRLIVPGWLHIDVVEPKFFKFNQIEKVKKK